MFAFYLSDFHRTGIDGGKGVQSDMTFGYYDKEKFTGEMRWFPVKYKYMFGIQLDDIKVKGKSINPCKDIE